MVHRILRQFFANERVIQQLSETRVLRSAARIFVTSVYRGRHWVENSSQLTGLRQRVQRFSKDFTTEYQKSLQQGKK